MLTIAPGCRRRPATACAPAGRMLSRCDGWFGLATARARGPRNRVRSAGRPLVRNHVHTPTCRWCETRCAPPSGSVLTPAGCWHAALHASRSAAATGTQHHPARCCRPLRIAAGSSVRFAGIVHPYNHEHTHHSPRGPGSQDRPTGSIAPTTEPVPPFLPVFSHLPSLPP